MSHTTVTLTQAQKEELIQFKAQLEQETGEQISQGEAVAIAAQKGKKWIHNHSNEL